MLIAVPKEIKNNEYRVGLTPAGAHELVERGHRVLVETKAGEAIGLTDDLYLQAGAEIAQSADEIYQSGGLIVKVKEPQPSECQQLHAEQILFCYLHLAADKQLTEKLMATGASCIAYETVTDDRGRLPLLTPMSEVAGRLSIQMGMRALENTTGGSGILLSGVPGVAAGNVVIIGGGVVGENAARIALGIGAKTTIIDKSLSRLQQLDSLYGPRLKTRYATKQDMAELIATADLIVGAVLVPGATAPKLITREMLSSLKPGTVLVDVAIDQGGCFETSRPTSHDKPTFVEQGITHYCVTNMPGAVARTSTFALTNATLPFIVVLADNGLIPALKAHPHLKQGLTVFDKKIMYKEVAQAHGLDFSVFEQ